MKIFEEYERYRKRGFDEKGALAKAVAHYYFPGIPGVWREFIQLETLKEGAVFPETVRAWERKEVVRILSYFIPEADARELVACARKVSIRDASCSEKSVSTGWYAVTLTPEGHLSISSANKNKPRVETLAGKWLGRIRTVANGSEGEGALEGAVAFTYTPKSAYHPITIAVYDSVTALIFLEIRLSIRGNEILQKLGWD